MNDDMLLSVMKPARYIGAEWNSVRKDFDSCAVRFALCFPDLYEVGMSNLGLRIIYGFLNRIGDVCCERFFSPAEDMERMLRGNALEIRSLENGRRMTEFDLVGFSLGHELTYTNVLALLDLGGIPLLASERTREHPLIIGGGACTLNPEPMHAFFDAFIIGEAEEVLPECIEAYRKYRDAFKEGRLSRAEVLAALAAVEGVYVPSLYEVSYEPDGSVSVFRPRAPGTPEVVNKRYIKDLENSFVPVEWLVPYIEIIHDRITLEVMRGCPNNCRFCQARQQYHPYRLRSIERTLRLAQETYACTGYEEISLAGLSVSDYPGVEELVQRLIRTFKERGVGVSLPSIKPNTLVGSLSSLIADTRKTGLTFAPEAATERLRLLLNKQFDTDSFFRALDEAFAAGYQRVKLYFMIGIPGEGEADLDAIADFAQAVSALRKKTGKGPARVSLSINTLIPKPFTALQWLTMESPDAVRAKQEYLKKKIRSKAIEVRFHDVEMSGLEAVLSRGDRTLSPVILKAFQKGCRFDAWEHKCLHAAWHEAFVESGVDPTRFRSGRLPHQRLPWEFIDIGVPRDFLCAEYNKLLAAL